MQFGLISALFVDAGDVAFLVGGWNGTSSTSSVFLYTPEGLCNYQLSSLPLATHTSAVAVLNGVITLCNGVMPDTKRCWKYIINTNEWTEIAPTPSHHPRQPAAAYNNKMYYLNTNVFGISEVFDPVKNTWNYWRSPPVDHGLHACMINWRDSMIVIGGTSNFKGVQLYNITTDTWKTLGTNPLGERGGHSCIQMPQSKDKYLIVGKSTYGEKDAAIYDANTNTWKKIADTNNARLFSSAAVLGNRMFVIGGAASPNVMLDTVEEYLIDKDVWEVKALRIPIAEANSAFLSLPATWFDSKNLAKPLANGCQGSF